MRSNTVEVLERALKGEVSGVRIYNNDKSKAVEVLHIYKNEQGEVVVDQSGTKDQLKQALTTFEFNKEGSIKADSARLSGEAQSVLKDISAKKKR